MLHRLWHRLPPGSRSYWPPWPLVWNHSSNDKLWLCCCAPGRQSLWHTLRIDNLFTLTSTLLIGATLGLLSPFNMLWSISEPSPLLVALAILVVGRRLATISNSTNLIFGAWKSEGEPICLSKSGKSHIYCLKFAVALLHLPSTIVRLKALIPLTLVPLFPKGYKPSQFSYVILAICQQRAGPPTVCPCSLIALLAPLLWFKLCRFTSEWQFIDHRS